MSILTVIIVTLALLATTFFVLRLSWKNEQKTQGQTFTLVSGIKAFIITELPFVAVRAWATRPFALSTEQQTEKSHKFAEDLHIIEGTIAGETWQVSGAADVVNLEVEEKKTVWISIERTGWYKFRDLLSFAMLFVIWFMFVAIRGIK